MGRVSLFCLQLSISQFFTIVYGINLISKVPFWDKGMVEEIVETEDDALGKYISDKLDTMNNSNVENELINSIEVYIDYNLTKKAMNDWSDQFI